MSRLSLRALTFAVPLLLAHCAPNNAPDKTAAGATLGAGWGAGAGAVIGNQIGNVGGGAAVGAGFGLVNGAIAGLGYDALESTQKIHEEELASLRMQNDMNAQQIGELQYKLDRAITADIPVTIHQVFFDSEATNLKTGAIANLQTVADAMRTSPHAYTIHVEGHADDGGTPDHNQRLAEARARNVAAYLGSRGISMGQIKVQSFGSERPLASNSTPEGRQLNRRVDVYIANE